MTRLARTLTVATMATALVAIWATSEKVRIDARAHLVAGDSLPWTAGDAETATLVAAGRSYASAFTSYVPLDGAPPLAAERLTAVTSALIARGETGAAVTLLEAALAPFGGGGIWFHPLVSERTGIETQLADARQAMRRGR